MDPKAMQEIADRMVADHNESHVRSMRDSLAQLKRLRAHLDKMIEEMERGLNATTDEE